MSDQTTIFDRRLLRLRQTRALPGFAEFDFLLRQAAGELAERLAEVRYDFDQALVFGGVGEMVRRVKGPELVVEAGLILTAETNSVPLQGERATSLSPKGLGAVGEGQRRDESAGVETMFIAEGPPLTRLPARSAQEADLCAWRGQNSGHFVIVADEEFLPFRRGAFDLIVSALSLQWVNDLPGALLQLRQALAPDGLFLATMLGGETLRELRQVLLQAESEITGGAVPRVSPAADLRDMAGLLQRAGFIMPVADNDLVTVTYPDIFALFRDLRGMGATSVLYAGQGHGLTRAILARAAELYQQRFGEAGRLLATFEFINLAGWTACNR